MTNVSNIRSHIYKLVFVSEKQSKLEIAYDYIMIVAINTFFDAIYWACVSLTTEVYEDIYPVSDLGRVVTMFSSLIGVALIVLPAGILTGGYMDEMRKETERAKSQ